MKLLNAWTLELDEPETAVSEILDQLDLEKNALKNSAGFLTCSYDFIESGIVKAICEALPFDVVGCTTLINANNNEADSMLLCLTVLTADDCQFTSVITGSFNENFEGVVGEAVSEIESGLVQSAKMALAFMPLLYGVAGEVTLNALDKALNGVPIFGTTACDADMVAYSNSYIIYNGECFRDCMSFLLISGNVLPRFVVTSTSEQNIKKQQAVITASEGSLLKEVNNMPVKDYFDSIGLITGEGLEGINSIPFVVDYNDGTQPVARAIYGLNENGFAVCGGLMPEGSILSIGLMDIEDILFTAEKSTEYFIDNNALNGIILFPCVGRNLVLVADPLAEINVVKTLIGDKVPWHLAYSGGESCPVYTKDGQPVNRFHNYTFIGCGI